MKKRRGGTCVEFAVVCPFLFAILFGIMECGMYLYVKMTTQHAAMVAARTGSLTTADTDDVERTIEQFMVGIEYDTPPFVEFKKCLVTVEIVVPYGEMSVFRPGIPDIKKRVVMRMEGCTVPPE